MKSFILTIIWSLCIFSAFGQLKELYKVKELDTIKVYAVNLIEDSAYGEEKVYLVNRKLVSKPV